MQIEFTSIDTKEACESIRYDLHTIGAILNKSSRRISPVTRDTLNELYVELGEKIKEMNT